MKTKLLILFTFFHSVIAFSQAPSIQWQKSYGGTNIDYAYFVRQTSDNGYIVAGTTKSNNVFVSGNHGDYDYWLIKLDDSGNLQWQKALGGSGMEEAYSVEQTSDGGYIIAGASNSNNGDVTGNHGSYDYWIVKLDNAGNIQWQKSFGGANEDYAYSATQTSDGGYIVAGRSKSTDGDVTGNHGDFDYWVLKLNNSGNIQWQKSYGGTKLDEAHSVRQTSDGGYAVTGFSWSNNGDLTGNHGNSADYWIVKLNNSGNIQWQKNLGGNGADYANSAEQTTDGGYIIAGRSISNDGDVSGNHGNYDYWVVKLNNSGLLQWQKSLGSGFTDYAYSVGQTSDGGYAVAGWTYPGNHPLGDVSGLKGYHDFWVVKLSGSGGLEWQKCLGGPWLDEGYAIQQTSDNGYIVAGKSVSVSGDVTTNYGQEDYWIVKLKYGSICGSKFNDLNANGVWDDGEPGLPDWEIRLQNASGTYTETTDADGNYCFTDLLDGQYTVSEVQQDGWIQTFPETNTYTITISNGQQVGNVDFGNTRDYSACATWSLQSSEVVTSTTGEITAETELLSQGSAPPYMYILGYGDNGQRLWQTGGWQGGPLDSQRYVEFSLSPDPGNMLTVTDVAFDYSDFLLGTDFHTLYFEAYYSVDNWQTSVLLGNGEYLGSAVQNFHVTINQEINEGETFSMRIFPYAPEHEGAIPSYATHSNVEICGTYVPLMNLQPENDWAKTKIYPNPAHGEIWFQSHEIIKKAEIIDLNGKKIKEFDLNSNQGKITLDGFPPAIYFLRLSTENNSRVFKIIKN
jgi:hypothetical protein